MMECVIKINMFDSKRPVAGNTLHVSWHMLEMIQNVAVVVFAALPQGDGVSLR